MSKYTLGLASITVGAIAGDGGMGQTLAALGYTYQDTCKLSEDDPESTEFYAEEVDDPVKIISKRGKTTFEFSIMDPDAAALLAILGGTVAAGPPKVWSAPESMVAMEKSVKITPAEGMIIDIPRGKFEAKMNGEFSKKGLFLIECKVTVLQPTKSGVSRIIITEPA